MLFSAAFKEDESSLLNTGRNSKSRGQLRDDLAEMLADQNPDEPMSRYKRASLKTLLTCADCVLVKHTEPFSED